MSVFLGGCRGALSCKKPPPGPPRKELSLQHPPAFSGRLQAPNKAAGGDSEALGCSWARDENGRYEIMTKSGQSHILEILVLLTGLAITLAVSCWAGWC